MSNIAKKVVTDNLGIFKIFSFVVTLCLIGFYDFLPKRTLGLHPLSTSSYTTATDEVVGGISKFTWLNEDKFKWTCDINEGFSYPYCSLAISWSRPPYKEIDFSSYTHLMIDMEYTGKSKYIRVFVRNAFDAGDNIDPLQSGKFNSLTKHAESFNQPISIGFNNLRVSDWWIEDYKVPPNLISPDVSRAIAIGVDLPYPAPLGRHEFELKSITAVGVYFRKESLYFSIIIFWTTLLLGEILYKFIRLHRKSDNFDTLIVKMSEETAIYKEKAETDKLTQLLNREGLYQLIKKLKGQDLLQQYALMVLDLDYFKSINDQYGHAIGDKVIQKTAQIINSCVRSYDIVARWGGEEFVVLYHCLNEDNTMTLAEKIRSELDKQTQSIGNKYRLTTVSIGVTKLNKDANFEESFERADKALYQAKNLGRNQTVEFK